MPVVKVTFPQVTGETAPHTRRTVYDGLGRRTREIDEAGVTTWFTYDHRGLLTSVTLDAGTDKSLPTHYTYDQAGNQLTQTDANNHTTTGESATDRVYFYTDVGQLDRIENLRI